MADGTSLAGKVCMVTGANRGLGRAAATELARLGATVVLVCRDAAKGREAAEAIRRATGNPSVELLVGDLSDLAGVREIAAAFLRTHDRLHVLVNNAGGFVRERAVTPQGLERMFATNHLAPFLLTNLLLDALKAGAPSRVITVSAPSTSELDFGDLQGANEFRPLHAFGASKAGNLLFTYALARRLEGSGVTANVLHPGLVRTGLMREAPAPIRGLLWVASRPPERAAGALVHLAAAPELQGVTGAFFKRTKRSDSSPYSRDRAVQDRLWDASARLAGLPT